MNRLYPVRVESDPVIIGGRIVSGYETEQWPLADMDGAHVEALSPVDRADCDREMARAGLALENGQIVTVRPWHGIQPAEVAA